MEKVSRKTIGLAFSFLLWAGVFTSLSFAQLPIATILGVVKDSSGAVVPGVSLTARSTDTGQTRTAVSGGNGEYRFSALPVGSYELRAEHAGFQTSVRSGLTLAVGQEAVADVTLQIGAVTQEVAVTAEASLVNTTSGSLGGLVSEQSVADLPLNGRNYIDLTFLQPGISENKNMTHGGTFVGRWFSSNGAPVHSNSYLLDGATMVNAMGGSAGSMANTTLGIEGIREWRVITNTFSAEYGLTMGSQMAVVTKGGTNSIHGSVFEYLRNSALDARNFFDYQSTASKRRLPAFTRNNFGGSIGGPVKKDKLFFFGTYEGLRERQGITTNSAVIPAACLADPTPCWASGVPGTTTKPISPLTKPLLVAFPIPNLPSTTPGNPSDRVTYPFTQPTTEDYGQGRMDWTISNSDTLFGRFTHDETTQVATQGFPGFSSDRFSKNQYSTVSESHVFSPNLLNTFRFSFSNTNLILTSPSPWSGPGIDFMPGQGYPILSIGGIGDFGPRASAPLAQNQKVFSWSDDLFYTRGAHSLKFGALVNHYMPFFTTGAYHTGRAIFGGISQFLMGQPATYVARSTSSILDSNWRFNTMGFYVQDDWRVKPRFTVNLGLRYEFITTPSEVSSCNATCASIQALYPFLKSSSVSGLGLSIRNLRSDLNTTPGNPFQNPSLRNFSPRVGFAWDVRGNGKTAVRGGAAILYDIATFGSALISLQWPYSSTISVGGPPAAAQFAVPLVFPAGPGARSAATLDYNMGQPHMLQYNLSVEHELPWSLVATVSYAGSRGMNLYQRKEGNPIIPQGTPGLDASGNRVCLNKGPVAFNPTGPECWLGTAPETRVNPNWNSSTYGTAGGNSFYNALQLQLKKRLSNGLQFQSAYTFSRSIDATQSLTDAEVTTSHYVGTDPFNRLTDRGLYNFDVTHNFSFNTLYRLPQLSSSGSGMGWLANGWWLSGIFSANNGFPFTPALGANRSRSGVLGGTNGMDRPDLVAGRNNSNITSGVSTGCQGVAAGTPLGTANLYYDPCAFTLQPAGFLGTAGRNILRGPGMVSLDFTVAKDTPLKRLGENGRLEFRAEFFNIINRVNLSTPEVGVSDIGSAAVVYAGSLTSVAEATLSSAGRILSTATKSRQIQFSLKLLF